MRKSNREVTDKSEIIDIMRRCDVCRLAFNNGAFPYILPLNFGLIAEEDRITLLFHSALEGEKVGLIHRDNRASFEMDCKHELQYYEEKGYCTMAYESVIGQGCIRILENDEKIEALQCIMNHYHPEKNAYFNRLAVSRTMVYCLEVEKITGKRKLLVQEEKK